MARPETHEPIVGIDLGTTNSLVAICDDAGPRVLPVLRTDDGQTRDDLLPSVVRYEPPRTGDQRPFSTVVGTEARRAAPDHPTTTIASVKRLVGRSAAEAASDASFLTYRVVAGDRGNARIEVPLPGGTLMLSPEEVSAEVLRTLKAAASAALGRDVVKAVITVPAYFDDAQRQATRTAARLAGLDAVRIVPEPTAAALAYGIGLDRAAARNRTAESTVCVFDLGGGTFDVSILRLTPADADNATNFYQVLATSGDTHLGGDDIDHLLVGLFTREINTKLGTTADLPAESRRGLLALAERVKITLSDRDQAQVNIDLGPSGSYARTVTRQELNALMEPLLARMAACCATALREARRKNQLAPAPDPSSPHGIDAVILVGGATRIPAVRARVAAVFGREPYTAIDPDKAVALGAAVQAAILSGTVKGSLLLDVIPLSLGIETVGGAVAKLIMRNSAVPASAKEMFSTSVDNQTSIRLTVYQGEREMAADCRKLGEVHVRNIPPMPAGVPQLEVTFLVDANGVLNLSATERRSGRRASLQVIPNHGLTPDEVDRMERDSLTHAREDMTRHRIVDLVANSSLDLKWIEGALARHAVSLDPSYATQLRTRIEELRTLVTAADHDWKSVDAATFQRIKEALDRDSLRLHEVSITASLRGPQGS
ncbi:MAG TPA: Hsp70 family protein [Phycisphaerales bacterium]|nr:Hsp70 family protein [Phycisphaerales bacterium]